MYHPLPIRSGGLVMASILAGGIGGGFAGRLLGAILVALALLMFVWFLILIAVFAWNGVVRARRAAPALRPELLGAVR